MRRIGQPRKNNYTYSKRITESQRKLLLENEDIKGELDMLVTNYLMQKEIEKKDTRAIDRLIKAMEGLSDRAKKAISDKIK